MGGTFACVQAQIAADDSAQAAEPAQAEPGPLPLDVALTGSTSASVSRAGGSQLQGRVLQYVPEIQQLPHPRLQHQRCVGKSSRGC